MPDGNVVAQGLRPGTFGGCFGRGVQRCLAVVCGIVVSVRIVRDVAANARDLDV